MDAGLSPGFGTGTASGSVNAPAWIRGYPARQRESATRTVPRRSIS